MNQRDEGRVLHWYRWDLALKRNEREVGRENSETQNYVLLGKKAWDMSQQKSP